MKIAERWQARNSEWSRAIQQRMAEVEAGRALTVAEMPIGFDPKPEERVLGVTPCACFRVKPVANRHTDDFLESSGRGYLFVTDERLVFSAEEAGLDWTESWQSIEGWGFGKSVMTVDCNSGPPVVFELDGAQKRDPDIVDGDLRCLSLIMEKASRSR